MVEGYYASAFWGVRKEPVEQCTQQTVGFLSCLVQCDPCLAHWFKTGRSRKEALKYEVKLDTATIHALLLAGRSRKDIGRSIIEELGFLIGLWNGSHSDAESASLTIQCGSYATRPGINFCELDLPYGEEVRSHLLQVPVLTAVMECMVSAWKPDWAAVMSRDYEKMLPFPAAHAPRMGWLVYLSSRRGTVPSLPTSVQVVPLREGSLIILTEERFTASNPVHVQRARQVEAILNQAGLLGPLI